MSALDTIEQLLSQISRAEKAQVLQWVVPDLGDAFAGIESRPDISFAIHRHDTPPLTLGRWATSISTCLFKVLYWLL